MTITLEIMTVLWRWNQRHKMKMAISCHIFLIACDVYPLCILFFLECGSIISPFTKFQDKSVLPEYAPLPKFVVPRHHMMIRVISSTSIYSGCKPVLHMQNTQVKLDEPSICKYGLGTLRLKGRT